MNPSQARRSQSPRAIGAASRLPPRPPRHRDEERRREQHAQREQRHGVDRMPRVGELDQDRLERKAEHADDGAQRTDPRRCGGSSVPPDQSGVRGAEDHRAERDPIPRERHEVVMRHVADQPAHADEGGDERGREADAESRQRLQAKAASNPSTANSRSRRTASESRGRTRTRWPRRGRVRTACRR